MKIIPINSVLIDGQHCAAGEVVEIRDTTAKAMIEQGFARKAPEATPAAAPTVPEVETAAAAPTGARRKK